MPLLSIFHLKPKLLTLQRSVSIQYILLFISCLALAPLAASAQVQRTTLFGVGHASVLDTYLTPYTYGGLSASVAHQTERLAHWGQGRVSVMGQYRLEAAMPSSRVSGARLYDAQLQLAGGMHYNWHLLDRRLRLAAGGLAGIAGGGSYSGLGGNNPAQGRLAAEVMASGIAEYRFPVKQAEWIARMQIDAPLLGAAFAQQFGESYYELFTLGHYDRNVRFTYPGNAPTLRLQATVSIPLGKSYLTFGYGADIRQSHLNGIKQHGWYNQFLIGYTRNITLSR